MQIFRSGSCRELVLVRTVRKHAGRSRPRSAPLPGPVLYLYRLTAKMGYPSIPALFPGRLRRTDSSMCSVALPMYSIGPMEAQPAPQGLEHPCWGLQHAPAVCVSTGNGPTPRCHMQNDVSASLCSLYAYIYIITSTKQTGRLTTLPHQIAPLPHSSMSSQCSR